MIQQKVSNKKYKPLIDNIDHYFSDSRVVLQDDRNMIKVVNYNNEPLVIKSYKKPSIFTGFIYKFLQKSKAYRAYEYGSKISEFTPEVVARIEYFQPFLKKSYLICNQFDFEFNLQKPLFYNHIDKNEIFRQFANFVYKLHEKQVFHKDLSPGNILVKKTAEKYEFKIVDINRMVFKKLSIKQRAKNFDKLWAHDTDLDFILREYAKVANFDKDKFSNLGLYYNQRNKNRKTFKRKVKQALGLWQEESQ